MKDDELFSKKLIDWLESNSSKTLESLNDVFQEKSIAVAILILMSVPALPIPTGGVTHVFEIITVILASLTVIGRKAIWIPKRWKHIGPGKIMEKKAIPKLARLIAWFEKRFKPNHKALIRNYLLYRLVGLLIILFTAFAFFAPPFSGLDTLPALGVVLICLSMILDNLYLLIIGTVVGAVGVALVLEIGKAVVHLFG